jgi:hypothetical protein
MVRRPLLAGLDLRRQAPRQGRSDVSYADAPDFTLQRPRSQERTFRSECLRAIDRASRRAGARSRPCVMEWRGPLHVRSVRPGRLFSQFLRCRLAPVRGSAIDGAASAVNRARTPARRGSSQGLCAVGRRMPCDARHFSLDGSIEMARRSSRSDEAPVPYGSVDVRVLGSMQSVISLPSR